MSQLSRRKMLAWTGVVATTTAVWGQSPRVDEGAARLRVLVTGGHPDDPESGCGGTMARYAKLGHEVTALYLTRGEAGIKRKTHDEAAAIRSEEAAHACAILNAKPLFAGQIDGASEVNPSRAAEFAKVVASVDPHVIFTQWPVDSHADHRACASLTLTAWESLGRKPALYFYEVDLGSQTQCFRPTTYVDVTEFEPLKREACMAHASQNAKVWYDRDHMPMMKYRGLECGTKLAEAFVHHDGSPQTSFPWK